MGNLAVSDASIRVGSLEVFMLSIYITFCLSFIPAGITHYLVKECFRA